MVGAIAYRPHVVRIAENNRSKEDGGRGGAEHVHPVYHLVFPRWGTVVIKHQGRLERFVPGTGLVISPGEPHCFMTNTQACCFNALTFEYLAADGGPPLTVGFHELLRLYRGTAAAGCGNRLAMPEAAAMGVQGMVHELAVCAGDDAVRCAIVLQRLILAIAGWQQVTPVATPADGRLEAVCAEVRRQFCRRLDLDALAAGACMSRRTLHRRFHEKLGVSVKQFQVQLRMDAARLMLRTTNMQVQEIAAEVGYGDLYQFSSAFAKRFGRAPSAFRRVPENAQPVRGLAKE